MSQEVARREPAAQQFVVLLEQNKRQIERALPKHVSVERIVRIAITEARMNPDLLSCEPMSFLGAVIQCAQLGLEPGKTLGQAYLVPFNNRKKGIREVTVMMGYQGMLQLVGNSIDSPVLIPRAVYEEDEFKYRLGLDPIIEHIPAQRPDPKGKLIYAYAIATFRDGRKEFDVMSRPEIEAIRLRAAKQEIWTSNYPQMACKTVIRRLYKFLPKSVELQRAIILDELSESNESQQNESVVASEMMPLHKGERVESRMNDEDPGSFGNFK